MHKLDTKAYQANLNSVSSYLYQQTLPKHKGPLPWILQELDAPTRISRSYYTEEPIIIPLKPTELLPDPKQQHYPLYEILEASDNTSIREKMATSISKLDHMFRRELVTSITPKDTASTKNTTEKTTTWTILDFQWNYYLLTKGVACPKRT